LRRPKVQLNSGQIFLPILLELAYRTLQALLLNLGLV
jgi:hypothetical protein